MNNFFKSLKDSLFIFAEDVYRDVIHKTPLKPKFYFHKNITRDYDFIEIERKTLSLDEVSVQYNPERFEQYQSVHNGVYDTVLKLSQSPHCQLLRDYNLIGGDIWHNFNKHPYYRLQRRFGKSRKSALNKAKRLTALFDEIKTNGFIGEITVLDKPLVPNPYNQGYEIFDGHHRAVCCITLGMKNVRAIIVKAVPKKKIEEKMIL